MGTAGGMPVAARPGKDAPMIHGENKKPCVALDVSKGSSHMQSFHSGGSAASEVSIIPHTKSGFAKLKAAMDSLRASDGADPVVVFECTGAYSKPLSFFLDSIKSVYYEIPPILSAKVRKSDIRPTKTDKRDCATIASVYYLKRLREAARLADVYEELRPLCSYYNFESRQLRSAKIKFRQSLDTVYPGIDNYFDVDTDSFLSLIEAHPDPHKLMSMGGKKITSFLSKIRYCGAAKASSMSMVLTGYLNDAAIYIREGDSTIDVLSSQAKAVIDMKASIGSLLERIITSAMRTEEYKYLITIPGIQKNTGARIAAEIAGISRFPDSSHFVSYIGIDPTVRSSGKETSDHLPITKKGNARLRCLLYLVVVGTCKSSAKVNPVRDFVAKKKSDGMSGRAAVIAGCNKLARIIYAVCSKREPFSCDPSK